MAKDPAFLFYPGDWNLGTMHMNLLEKGAYIELLMLQFSRGKFTIAHAKHMLNGSFDLAWPTIKEKFQTDGEFFWNERLEFEKNKRAKFTKSRRDNALKEKEEIKPVIKKRKKKSTSLASAEHMHGHMENENENEIINKDIINKGGAGEKSVYTQCMDLYFQFIIQRMGVKPNIDATQGKFLNQIIAYLRTLKTDVTDEDIVNFWDYILKHWSSLDNYLSNKLKLNEIYSEMINIINQIKNPKPKLNNQKTLADKQNELSELDRTLNNFLAIKNAK
jgi:uncharacterized protein YdaU (DUF1376 family)